MVDVFEHSARLDTAAIEERRDSFNQVLWHIGIVSQQLLGVLGQAIAAARCQVLDNIFHKFLF